MHIRIFLAVGLMLTQAWAVAQAPDAPSSLSLHEARAQRAKARTMKAQAKKTYDADVKVCQSKAIAIGCTSSAKDRRAETLKRADALELEGRTVERETLRREAAAKAAKREAEAPVRQARDQADAERFRDSEAKRAAERERRQAGESARLESHRRKLAADQAAHQKKLEKQQKDDIKREAAAADNVRRKAEGERQHEDRVRKIEERKRAYAEKLQRREAKQAAQQAAQATAVPAK